MLDRDSELEVIRTAVTTVSAGSGSALIVEGVAGIGKTRLVAQGCAFGERAGLKILRASCGEFEAAYPWGMVRQVFDRIVCDDSAGGPRRFLRDARRLALPALGLGVAAGGRKDDEFALLHGLYWLAADMARESPLLIDSAAAHQELAAHGLTGDLGPTWPANRVRYARACLHAADGDHRRAADDLLAAGDLAERWRMRNPALMNWRSAAALFLAALGRGTDARQLCAEELRLALGWGPGRALGIALRAAGITSGGQRGIEPRGARRPGRCYPCTGSSPDRAAARITAHTTAF